MIEITLLALAIANVVAHFTIRDLTRRLTTTNGKQRQVKRRAVLQPSRPATTTPNRPQPITSTAGKGGREEVVNQDTWDVSSFVAERLGAGRRINLPEDTGLQRIVQRVGGVGSTKYEIKDVRVSAHSREDGLVPVDSYTQRRRVAAR